MSKKKKHPELEYHSDDDSSPSQETRDLHVGDVRLRKHGFKIHSRANNQPAIWVKDKKVFTQTEAEEIVRKEESLKNEGE